MEAWRIVPNEALGPLRLGEALTACEAVVGRASDSFKRVPESSETVFVYREEAVHITVDSNHCVVELSAFPPRRVTLAEVQLLGRPLRDVAEELSAARVDTEPIEVGLCCPEAGVTLVEVESLIDGVELRHIG